MAENESVSLNVEQAGAILENMTNDFTKLISVANTMTSLVTDLQKNFYGPDDKGVNLLYKDYKANLGTADSDQGLYPAIKGTFKWCSAVDEYVQNYEKSINQDDNYDSN